MKKVSLLVAFALIFTATSAFAGGNTGVGFGTQVLEGKKGKAWELLATCLNGICCNGAFAITSGTLGYKEGLTIAMNDVEIYVAKNMDSLATDIARGDGEYVNTLASMMKVEDVASFKSKLKNNFDRIYSNEGVTSKQVVQNINEVKNS